MASRGHLQLEIYKDTAPQTLVDIIDARVDPQFLTELQNHGAGSFKISKRNKKILRNPSLIDYRNIVRVRLVRADGSDPIIGAFLIQTKKTVIVGSGEAADEMWEISGEGIRSWFKDASVFPATGLKRTSKEKRYFNFAAERNSWYNAAQWVDPIEVGRYNSGGWHQTAPANWPDAPNAFWLWDRSQPYEMPKGTVYFRVTFTTSEALASYSLFFGVDDAAEVYVDGELLMTTAEHAWQEVNRLDFSLEAGEHIIAFKASNSFITGGPGALIAAIFRYGDPNVPSSAQLINYTTGAIGGSWKINPYPATEPGWTPGEILRVLIQEAQQRGVRFAGNISLGFSDKLDSNGDAWGTPQPWAFDIGASYADVLEALEETACDVYLDPTDLRLYAWNKRGRDRSKDSGSLNPIVFSRGHNLLSGDETGQAQITNRLLVRTADGWVLKSPDDNSSVSRYGVVENQLSTDMSEASANGLLAEVFRQRALPERSATFEVFDVPNMTPFLDYDVGDYVSAPNENNVQEDRRVMSISVTENSSGTPVYTVEFDSILKDRQSQLEKQVSRSSGGGSAGGGLSGSSNLPSTVINLPPVVAPIAKTPDRPEWVSVSSAGSWTDLGSPRSSVSFQWTAVNTSNQDPITDVEGYELWGYRTQDGEGSARILATPTDTYATVSDLVPSVEWNFFVRAMARSNGPGVPSVTYKITTTPPVVPLLAPTPPVLSSDLGAVVIEWDGILGNAPAPAHYKSMIVERSSSPNGPWVPVTMFTNVAGQDTSGNVGSTYQYRLIALDNLNNESAPSAPASITVKGVVAGQIAVGAVISENIAANAVSVSQLANGAVTQAKISPGAVGSNEIQDFALTAKKFNTNRHMLF